MDTVEKVATFGYTRHRMKTNKTKTKNTKQKDEQHGPNQKPGLTYVLPKEISYCFLQDARRVTHIYSQVR